MMAEDNGRDQSMIFYLSVKVRVFSYLLVLCMMEEGNYDTSFEYDNDIWKKSMDWVSKVRVFGDFLRS